MSLPHALLTSLLERPSSGYDLARRFDSSIGFFWRASHQQIYRELARMTDAGWVASEEDPGHATRRVHRCLPAGRAELARWTGEGGSAPVVRDALLVRMRAAAALGSAEALGSVVEQVRGRLAEHDAALAGYHEIERRDFGDGAVTDEATRVQQAILHAGIRYEESGRSWCLEVLDTFGA